jgi:hypothetical protein
MAEDQADTWEGLWSQIDGYRTALGRSRAVNVNASALRGRAKDLVKYYFREGRPGLVALGVSSTHLQAMDGPMQDLLQLSNGRNSKSSYTRVLGGLRRLRPKIESERELLIGARHAEDTSSLVRTRAGLEGSIVATLTELVPSAAFSYEQALRDLQDGKRVSYRGTALELREALREVLDRLAPDQEVQKSEGFRLDKGCTRPTMKQKAGFVLRSRDLPENAIRVPQEAAELIEDVTASLARSTYVRGSVATHLASTRRDVQQLRRYVDAVLCELLEIPE